MTSENRAQGPVSDIIPDTHHSTATADISALWRAIHDSSRECCRWPASVAWWLGIHSSDAYRAGYEQAEADMAQRWHTMHERVAAVLRQPTRADLRSLRGGR